MGQARTFGAPSGGRTPRADPDPSALTPDTCCITPVDTIARASPTRLIDVAAGVLPDGVSVFVRSVRDFFVLDKDSALVPDNITIADAIGGGQWLRRLGPSIQWLTQTSWFIDTAAADDEGTGLVGDPLQTHAELGRRAVCQGKAIKQTTSVTIVASLPVTDPVEIDVKMPVPDTYLHYFGAPTTIRSGTFDAVTPLVSGFAPTSVTDAVGGSFAAQIGKRVRMTSGLSSGARATLTKDEGGSVASTSPFFQQDTVGPPAEELPTLVNPTTDDYVIEDLPTIQVARVKASRALGGAAPPVIFEDLLVGTPVTDDFTLCTNCDRALFVACDVTNHAWDKTQAIYSGCQVQRGTDWQNSDAQLVACAVLGTGYTATDSTIAIGLETAAVVAQLIPVASTSCRFLITDASGQDAAGASVDLGPVESCESTGLLWGIGNGTFGIRCRGGVFWYDVATQPTITGATDDTRIGGVDKAYAGVPFFNSANNSGLVETPT